MKVNFENSWALSSGVQSGPSVQLARVLPLDHPAAQFNTSAYQSNMGDIFSATIAGIQQTMA